MKNIYYLFILVIAFINISNAQQVIDTINVSTGWNIIGALSSGATLDIISTEPPDIITSPFYGFSPGASYYQADSLKRGTGYWVKVSQDGKLIYMSFTDCGTVDYAGKIYNTVLIGDQCWLKENLDLGTMIPVTQNSTNNGIIEKYCYNNDPAKCTTYGAMYQWDEAMQYITTEGAQGICPLGWHIPTLSEFQTLATTVDYDGNALKAIGQGYAGGAGTNTSGFSALLGGYRDSNGYFYGFSIYTYIWSSTDDYNIGGYDIRLNDNVSDIFFLDITKEAGFNVRCVKD